MRRTILNKDAFGRLPERNQGLARRPREIISAAMGGVCSVCALREDGERGRGLCTACAQQHRRVGRRRAAGACSTPYLFDPQVKRVSVIGQWLSGGLFAKGSGRAARSRRGAARAAASAGESSGKSTVVKKMKSIHSGGFSAFELASSRPPIHRDIHVSVLALLERLDRAKLDRSDEMIAVVLTARPCGLCGG
jgi:hypothetical protein